jgi:hypothetical protein
MRVWCVFSANDGCSLFLHINLSENGVKYLPSVDIERRYASKSGAEGAGVVFLRPKSLGLSKFETYEFERFEWNGIVQHPISQNVVLDFTFGRY